jgi:hypothetical protein
MKIHTDLAQVVKTFGKSFLKSSLLSPQQTKVLHQIVSCGTATLGGHKELCDSCGAIRYHYNSCGDRHCPKCQYTKQIKWIDTLQKQALPVKHYHIIFTVPHSLNQVCLWDNKFYFSILFKSVWETLRSFGYTYYGVESGAIAVLHTWGQNLSLHPHVHCIVPSVGVDLKGNWKHIGKKDKYLYPVKQLSATFKGKFLYELKRKLKELNHTGFSSHIQKAYSKNWVVFSEAPMSGVNQVIKYLGQYTHRIAISNQRILGITDNQVRFLAKDYRDNATVKKVKLQGVEFLRRFVQHVLPKGFMRIRRYGVYNATTQRNLNRPFTQDKSSFEKLVEQKEKELELQILKVHRCPVCEKGKMIVVSELPRIRSPVGHLPSILLSLLN